MPEDNIKLVRGNGDGTPINQDIKEAMKQLDVRERKRRGSRLYFYYAGHGIGPMFNDVALIPADASVDEYDHTFFGIALCFDFFVKTGFFDEVVAFLDCCREELAVKAIGFPWEEDQFTDAAAAGVNLFAMVGSTHGGKSNELRTPPLDELRYRGLMTEVLLDGLNGAPGAIDAASGAVTTESLLTYVRRRVEAEATARSLPQRVDPFAHPGPAMTLLAQPTIATLALGITVGPQSAGVAMFVQNMRTMVKTPIAAGTAGQKLPDIPIAADTRHQLIVPTLADWPIIDPTTLGTRCDVILP